MDRVEPDQDTSTPKPEPDQPELVPGITIQVRKGGQYFVDAESTQPEE